MAGYRRKLKKIAFTEGDYAGLELQLRSLSIRQIIEMESLTSSDDGDAGQTKVLVERLHDALHSWNLEDDDGNPVPTDIESIRDQDFAMLIAIVTEWMDTGAGVPAPLDQPSSNGVPSEVLSIPMEALSASPPN